MKSSKSKLAGIILLIAIIIIAWRVIDYLPVIGDPNSPPNTHVSKVYIEEGPANTNSPNLVTGVLADYRGFDTLLETTVMFLACFSVAMILSNRLKKRWDRKIFEENSQFCGVDIKVVIPLVVPCIVLYAFYVLFHGEVSLGGGFQAGTLLATAFILYIYLANIETRLKRIKASQHFFVNVAALGVLIYAFTGILPMLNGGKYLEYGKLPFPAATAELHSIGILMIEIGVTICVMSSIITILEAVLERNSLNVRIK